MVPAEEADGACRVGSVERGEKADLQMQRFQKSQRSTMSQPKKEKKNAGEFELFPSNQASSLSIFSQKHLH